MENNKLERIIFILLRVFGTLAIIGGYLGEEGFYQFNTWKFGHVILISPALLVAMIVTIVLYDIFLRFLQKHISITKKNV